MTTKSQVTRSSSSTSGRSREHAPTHSESYKTAAGFIAHYCGPKWRAEFAGNDHFAFEGFCSAVPLWGRADAIHQPAALLMLRGAVMAIQEHLRHTAYLAIIALLDWEIAGRLIPQIVPSGDATSVVKFTLALSKHGDQDRPRLGPLQLDPARAPLLRLQLWPDAPMLDLAKASDRAQLSRLEPEDFVRHGWDWHAAMRWWFALCSLADSDAERWLDELEAGAVEAQRDGGLVVPMPTWLAQSLPSSGT